MDTDAQLYVSQKAIIEKDGKILVLFEDIFGLDLPGGKVQVGEYDFEKALKREVLEETKLDITVGSPFTVGYFEIPTSIKHRNAGKKIYIVFFVCKYLSGELILSEEHKGFRWIDKSQYLDALKECNDECFRSAIKKYFETIVE